MNTGKYKQTFLICPFWKVMLATFAGVMITTKVGLVSGDCEEPQPNHVRCLKEVNKIYITGNRSRPFEKVTCIDCASRELLDMRHLIGDVTNVVTFEKDIFTLEWDFFSGISGPNKRLHTFNAFGIRVAFTELMDSLKEFTTITKLNMSCPSLGPRPFVHRPLSESAMASLRELDVINSNIKSVDVDVFKEASNLRNLSLSENLLKAFPEAVLSHIVSHNTLKRLDLSHNRISTMSISSLPMDCTLEHLNLDTNEITGIPPELLQRCRRLKSIVLNNNRNLSSLESLHVFSGKTLELKLVNTCLSEVGSDHIRDTSRWSVSIDSPCLLCDCGIKRLFRSRSRGRLTGHCLYNNASYDLDNDAAIKQLWKGAGVCEPAHRPPCPCLVEEMTTEPPEQTTDAGQSGKRRPDKLDYYLYPADYLYSWNTDSDRVARKNNDPAWYENFHLSADGLDGEDTNRKTITPKSSSASSMWSYFSDGLLFVASVSALSALAR